MMLIKPVLSLRKIRSGECCSVYSNLSDNSRVSPEMARLRARALFELGLL